jgi:phosphoribosylformylglycinamidine synthase
MKNDATLDGVKISIPPTLLVSVMGQIADVARVVGMEPRREGDDVWLLGATRDELGESAALRLGGFRSGTVPTTDPESNATMYRAFAGLLGQGRIASAHALGRGGLAAALAQWVLASGASIDVALERLETGSAFAELFSESTGRILFCAAPADREAVEKALGGQPVRRLGVVGPRDGSGRLRIESPGGVSIVVSEDELRARFERGLAVA